MSIVRWTIASVLGVACVFAFMGSTAGVADQTSTGIISDSQCGGDHGGEVDVRECTPKFADLPAHAGHQVTVSGELADGQIRISKMKITMQRPVSASRRVGFAMYLFDRRIIP